MSREHWEENQLEDLFDQLKDEGHSDEDAEKIAKKTFYRENV